MNQTATAENETQVIQMDEIAIIKELNIQEIQQANIDLMEKQILEIPETPEDAKQYNKAKDFHIAAKKILPQIETRRVEIKKKPLEKCRLIDDVAKKAKAMVQPLIELSGDRRFAWEKIKEAERAAKVKIETDRLEKIEWMFGSLAAFITVGQKYNLSSGQISKCIDDLNEFEVSSIDFEDQTETAEALKISGLESLKRILADRVKWEADQAEAARIKAETEAAAKKLADDQAAFKADQDKAAAEQKAKDDAAAKIAAQEAEKTRKANEKLEADRLALEEEKAEIARVKQAEIDRKFASDWDDAHLINFNMAHEYAINFNRVIDEEMEAQRLEDILECHTEALGMNVNFDRAKADDEAARVKRLSSEKARAELIAADKKTIAGMITIIDAFISEFNALDGEYKTDEGAQVEVNLVVRIKESLDAAEKAGEALV